MTAESVFLTLLAALVAPVVYSYILYPVGLALLAHTMRQNSPINEASDPPSVTLLVAAHNEAAVIGERVQNALAMDYPENLLEVLIASDGSIDDTEQIVERVEDERLRLLSHHPNRGKSYTLNRAVIEARGDIVVMSDANTRFAPDAVQRLVRRLQSKDKPIAVCGKLILVDPESGDNVDGLYWRFESWQKKNEGDLAATLGANGGIYAFRRADYCPIPDNTIIDDMTIPLLMKLRHSGSVVFDEHAIAYEDAAPSMADEFERRVRIGTGAYQSIPVLWQLLKPRYGFTALAFFSHKILRWFTPHLLLLAALVTLAGLREPAMQMVAMVWLTAIGIVLLGRNVRGCSPIARLLRLAAMFASMNIALMAGFWRWYREDQTGTWKRTSRESEDPDPGVDA